MEISTAGHKTICVPVPSEADYQQMILLLTWQLKRMLPLKQSAMPMKRLVSRNYGSYDSGRLTIHLLRDGQYVKFGTSPTFPEITITQNIPTVVERSWQVGSVQALEEFETVITEGSN